MDPTYPLAITETQYVSSYSWEDCEMPTIAVPGHLAKWVNRDDEPLLEPDTASRYLDLNASKFPRSPMEPAIRAVLYRQPNFQFHHLDVITDRYALSSLLEMAGGKAYDFSFGAQVVGNTIVFIRNDPAALQVIEEFRGFRKDFGKKYLQHAESCLAHYRIITYRLGELEIMLRYKVDGYLPHDSEANDNQPKESKEHEADTCGELNIIPAGKVIPNSALLELNTFKKKMKNEQGIDECNERMNRKLHEAWISQNHHYAMAQYIIDSRGKSRRDFQHFRGKVPKDGVKFYLTAELMSNWAIEKQDTVRKFYDKLQNLLQTIRIAAVEGHGDTFIVEGKEGDHDVKVTPSTNIPALSPELCARLR